jgi:hypothetical protein
LINLFVAILFLTFLVTAFFRKLNWVITVLVLLVLLTGIYFCTINIEYNVGCESTVIYQRELIPSWWTN